MVYLRMISATDLRELFVEALDNDDAFEFENGNPFLIKLHGKRYYIFLKNLSPAYFKNSPDIVRIQLPFSEKFQRIIKSIHPLIVLGYSDEDDIFTSWSPVLIKSRLNNRTNVSLYSRREFNKKALVTPFATGLLMTGEQVVTFRRRNLKKFLLNPNALFDSNKVQEQSEVIENSGSNGNFIYQISDKQIIRQLSPLIKKGEILDAVQLCSKLHGKQYSQMSFSDWFNVVNKLRSDLLAV